MTDVTIITGAEAEAIRTSLPSERRTSPDAFAALLRGDVIYVPDSRVPFNAHRLKTIHRLRLRSRKDGNGGRHFWTEPIE